MKNVHLISTEKPSRLHLIENALTITSEYKNSVCDSEVNIYITSDEEIKEDWVIYNNELQKSDSISFKSVDKKIILTTDPDLIKDGVQAIDDEFLEWFVKNPSCEWVETNVEFIQTPDNLKNGFYYKIIIPKEEPKYELELKDFDNTNILDVLNIGNVKYLNNGDIIYNPNLFFVKRGDKWFIKATEKPIQETLEEAANKQWGNVHRTGVLGFIEGAKWQQERMYSEEEVIELLQKALTHKDDGEIGSLVTAQGEIRPANFFSWFNKFKNK